MSKSGKSFARAVPRTGRRRTTRHAGGFVWRTRAQTVRGRRFVHRNKARGRRERCVESTISVACGALTPCGAATVAVRPRWHRSCKSHGNESGNGPMKPVKLVMVGNGMAGVRTLEELVSHAPGLYDITV